MLVLSDSKLGISVVPVEYDEIHITKNYTSTKSKKKDHCKLKQGQVNYVYPLASFSISQPCGKARVEGFWRSVLERSLLAMLLNDKGFSFLTMPRLGC
jgi:hypothetical protein